MAYAACDNERWGAYAVGALYARAMAENSASEADWAVAREYAADSESRRIGGQDTDTPDMSSEGVIK